MARASVRGERRHKLRVLLVEDDFDAQLIAQFALVDLGGFDVRSARTPSEALAAADEFKPELIILDVMLPGMDGTTLLKALRQLPSTERTPVIFMTASARNEAEFPHSAEAIGLIPKPFDPMTLHETVSRMWNGRSRKE